MMSTTPEHAIDSLIVQMMNAEGERRLCQRDLLDIRREGPRATRANSATGVLQLCRFNRQQALTASARMRQLYQEITAL